MDKSLDKLDQLISAKRVEIEETRKRLEALQAQEARLMIELQALERASKLRPSRPRVTTANGSQPPKSKKQPFGGRKGRQRGDISHEWRGVLRAIRALHKRVSYEDVQTVATAEGIKTKMPNVRERVRMMVDNGLMTGTAVTGFLVTAEAVRRFDLDSKTGGADLFAEPMGSSEK
jgi:ATP-dependent Clp protease ATP-binding subunit ClpA